MSKRPYVPIIIGVILTTAFISCGDSTPERAPSATAGSHEVGKPETHAKAATTPVQTLIPQRRDLSKSLSLPANVSPWAQVTLFAKVPGYLKWMGADKGDRVKQGQLLAVIDAPEIEQQYKQAEADYRIKHVTYERLHRAWKENPDVVAKQDVDVAESAAKTLRYLRDSKRTLLGYTKVSAPFDGTITARFADPGALIQAATGSATQAAPLFTLMDIRSVRIYVSVPQEAALLAKPGAKAIVTARELPGQEFTTTIARTTQALDPATRTLLVELNLPNQQQALRPGMFVTARLILEEHPQVLVVPPAALVASGPVKTIFIIEDGRAKQIPVKTGFDDGVWVEITDGLQDNMEVIVVGKTGLTDGQAVEPSPYNLPVGTPAHQKL
ncbi:efflux RND transporter periplasmic adaptor subunit [Petrachloros mirabilis]